MKSVEFCYWLQGYFELYGPKMIDEKETELIKRHLCLVFKHEIDSSYGNENHQQELQSIHDGSSSSDDGVVYKC